MSKNPRKWCGTATTCQICRCDLRGYMIDGATRRGPWAIMCLDCHADVGIGLGVDRGQRYVERNGEWWREDDLPAVNGQLNAKQMRIFQDALERCGL